MKYAARILTLVTITLLSIPSAHALYSGSPAALKIKLYKFAVSTNADCSNPVVVVDNSSNPQFVDMLGSPNFGSGALASGTYQCVIFEMSDNIQFKVGSDGTGNCVANTTYTLDVSRGDNYELIDGTEGTTNSTYGHDDRVALHISTASTSTGGGAGTNAWLRPTAGNEATRGFKLSGALTVAGDATGTFVVDGTGQVSDGGTSCDMGPPVFSFK